MSKRLLSNWIEAYLEYVDNTEPCDLYKKWSAISAIAAVLQRKCWTKWDRVIYPNMYIVLVGPASSRKGTAMLPVTQLLMDVGVSFAAESTTRESLIQQIKEAYATTVLTTDDGKEEIILHSSLTIMSEELQVLLGHDNKALISNLTDWFDCGKGSKGVWAYRTKNMGWDKIIGIWVNLLGAVTPELLRTSLPQEAIGGGFTRRVIFIYADDKGKIVPDPFTVSMDEELYETLKIDLDSISTLAGQFKLTPGFVQRKIDWYIESEKNPPFEAYEFRGYNNTRSTHLMKLCMVVSAARTNSMILEVEDFDYALSLLEEAEQYMPGVFSAYGKSPISEFVPQVMQAIARKGQIEYNRLMEMFWKNISRRDFEEMIQSLIDIGFCQEFVTGKTRVLRYIKRKEET